MSKPGLALAWRQLDPTKDAPILQDWVSRPYAHFWGQAGLTAAELEARYREGLARGQDRRMAFRADTRAPIGMVEVYDPSDDELGRHYPVAPGDLGFHLLLCPPDGARAGMTHPVITGICTELFANPAVHRLVLEPDLRNRRVIARLMQAGFRRAKVVYLPHKIALLMTIDRSQAEAARSARTPPMPRLPAWSARVLWHRVLGRIARSQR